MNILWIGTKSPWPPVDGGRLIQKLTIEALVEAGADVTCVFPVVANRNDRGNGPDRPRVDLRVEEIAVSDVGWAPLLGRRLRGVPLSVGRHAFEAMGDRIKALLGESCFDVVHVEQLQAWPRAWSRTDGRPPVVLRAQNVESELWRASGGLAPAGLRSLLRREADCLARWEGTVVARAAAVVAVTETDAAKLRRLSAGRADIRVVPAPFPAGPPSREASLPGAPPLVLIGDPSWPPNRDAVRWFMRDVWPALHRVVPEASAHLFGPWARHRNEPRVHVHPAPSHSREVFIQGAVLVVPLRFASGVRMKILEAWARRIPVVATSVAATGLDAENGVHLLIADTPAQFAEAISRLQHDQPLQQRLVTSAASLLERRHRPDRVVRQLLDIYESARGGKEGAMSS
jgi:glycosyltransferase involved in cell wall biosynthesis